MAGKDMLVAVGPSQRISAWQVVAVSALLAWYFASALSAVAGKCATFDEPYHLAGGYAYWTLSDFRLHPENGNLPQRWAAIPLLLGGYQFPSEEQTWRSSMKEAIGPRFLYWVGNDADGMLARSRAMIALLGVALGALVFGWTRRLAGVPAAFTSLTLYAFCPTILTNSALATSDMAAALFFTATVACLWMVLHRVTWRSLLLSSLVMGGLFVAKFSAPLVLIMGALLVAVQLASPRPLVISWKDKLWEIHARRRRLPAHLAVACVHALVVWGVIWACYSFRYEMFHPAANQAADSTPGQDASVDTIEPNWDMLLEHKQGLVGRVLIASRELHFLPEAYLYGFAYVHYYAQERPAFLNGAFSMTGWPQFFPYCLLVKTPLTLLALMGLAVAAIGTSWRGGANDSWQTRRARMTAGLYRAAPLWSLFLVYWAFAITSHLNIGHRHLLPTYPPMIILAGSAALWLRPRGVLASPSLNPIPDLPSGGKRRNWLTSRRQPVLALATISCVALFALESVCQWPNYLTYFNQLIGSQQYAYRRLVDSSLDWGQDLPALKEWLVQQGLDKSPAKVHLSYFGVASPQYYGIDATPLPSHFVQSAYDVKPFGDGTYCISATMLQAVYTAFPHRWNPDYEQTYQTLRAAIRQLEATADNPTAQKSLIDQSGGIELWKKRISSFHLASFARLCSYLCQREPDAEINYSILIYQLSRDDLSRALEGPPPELTAAPRTQFQ